MKKKKSSKLRDKKILKPKLIALLIGLFLVFMTLEAALRVTGYFYKRYMKSYPTELNARAVDAYTIVCFGNSHTEGAGAPPGESYPDHLQRLLDSQVKGKNFTVINKGLSGQNTAELLEGLEPVIDETKPDLVVLGTGEVNTWNQYKFSSYLKRESKRNNSLMKMALFSLYDCLYEVRVYRLILLVSHNLNGAVAPQKISGAGCGENQEDHEAVAWHDAAIRNRSLLFDEQKREKAIRSFKNGIEVNPACPGNYLRLGNIYFYQGNYEEAAQWYMEGINANPNLVGDRRQDNINNKNYFMLRNTLPYLKGEQVTERLEDFKRKHPEHSDDLRFVSSEEIDDWSESDIREIIRILQGKKIKVIMQNYPPKIDGMERSIDWLLREIADDLEIPFVDNEKVFQEMWDKGVSRKDYHEKLPFSNVSGDHLNSVGYKVMAQNVFDVIMEENLLNLTNS